MKLYKIGLLVFLSLLFLGSCKKPKEGCLDPLATNYDATASYNSICFYSEKPVVIPIDTPIIPSDTNKLQKIKISITPMVNGKRFYFGTNYKDEQQRDFQITFFKYFVSNIKLGDRSITKADIADIELIDYDTSTFLSATRPIYDHIIEGEVKAGMYNRIFIGCGVDPIWNEEYSPNDYPSEHPLNTTYTNMDWTWQTKYKFTSIEGNIDSDADGRYDRAFFMHTGFSDLYRQAIVQAGSEIEVKEGLTTFIELELDIVKVFDGLDIATKQGQTHTNGAEQLEFSRTIQTNLAKNIKFVGVTYE
jgi:hypothetical protein|tara:strand:- start:1269 stop:2180 length:912 start_codon:yes stop_codon:yes gene_type:complete